MRSSRVLVGLALAATLGACVSRPGTLDFALAPGAQWTVTIPATSTNTLHGTVTFVRTEPRTQTRAIFALYGGTPNAVLPWHVHYGVCGDDQLIVGRPSNYPPLVLGGNGNLAATAQLPVELVDRTNYVIHIHASAVDMRNVVACGALAPERAVAQRRD
jgi:hypothetical protein